MEYKRLYKSSTDKAIFGVCGGIAEYFGIDSLIVRLVLALFTLAFGSGLLFYILAAILMPKRPEDGGMPVQPEEPGSYNAGGATYVNRASSPQDAHTPYTEPAQTVYREAMSREETRAAAEPAPSADPVESAWQKEYAAQQERTGVKGEEPSGEKPRQGIPQEEPKREAPRPEKPYHAYQTYQQPQGQAQRSAANSGSKTRILLGALLIILGVFVLIRVFLPRFDVRILFAILVILAGGLLIAKRD